MIVQDQSKEDNTCWLWQRSPAQCDPNLRPLWLDLAIHVTLQASHRKISDWTNRFDRVLFDYRQWLGQQRLRHGSQE